VPHLTAAIAGFIIATISSAGYLGIAALMAIESACIPLPSEIIMPFSGYLASTGRFDLVLAATAGAAGCNIGSTIAYFAGRAGGRPFLERWGYRLLISRRDLLAADRFFLHFGAAAVLIGRLLPVIRTFIAFPAGIVRMGQLRFQVYTFIGSWPWCFALAYIGYRLGQRWDSDPRLRAVLHRCDLAIAVLIVLGVGLYVRRHLRRGEQG
jgi:membrane protein DedA with SNARE-associated domain